MAYKSRQHAHGGGKFQSEAQRKFMWARVPSAARSWAHNKRTRKPQWIGAKGGSGPRIGGNHHRGKGR